MIVYRSGKCLWKNGTHFVAVRVSLECWCRNKLKRANSPQGFTSCLVVSRLVVGSTPDVQSLELCFCRSLLEREHKRDVAWINSVRNTESFLRYMLTAPGFLNKRCAREVLYILSWRYEFSCVYYDYRFCELSSYSQPQEGNLRSAGSPCVFVCQPFLGSRLSNVSRVSFFKLFEGRVYIVVAMLGVTRKEDAGWGVAVVVVMLLHSPMGRGHFQDLKNHLHLDVIQGNNLRVCISVYNAE